MYLQKLILIITHPISFISFLHFRYSYWLSNNEIPILLFACFRLFFTLSILEKIILLIILIIGIKIGKIQVKHKIPLTRFLRDKLESQFLVEEPVPEIQHYTGFSQSYNHLLSWYSSSEEFFGFCYKIYLIFYRMVYLLLCSFSFLQLFINRFPRTYLFSRYCISFFLIFSNFSIFLPLITIYSMISRLMVFRVDDDFKTLIGRLLSFTGQKRKIKKVAVTRKNTKILTYWYTRNLAFPKTEFKDVYETDYFYGYTETLKRLHNAGLLKEGKINLTSSKH